MKCCFSAEKLHASPKANFQAWDEHTETEWTCLISLLLSLFTCRCKSWVYDLIFVSTSHFFGGRCGGTSWAAGLGNVLLALSGGPRWSCTSHSCAFRAAPRLGTTCERVPEAWNNLPIRRSFSCIYQCTIMRFKLVNIFFFPGCFRCRMSMVPAWIAESILSIWTIGVVYSYK